MPVEVGKKEMQEETSTPLSEYPQKFDQPSASDQTINEEKSKPKTIVENIDQLLPSDEMINEKKSKHETVQNCMAQPVTIIPSILNIVQNPYSFNAKYCTVNNSLMYEYLYEGSLEHDTISSIFEECDLTVVSIRKVHNQYLRMAFELKRHFHYNNIIPRTLYHGTKKDYVDSICSFNFNWRLSGRETGHMFGKGVNFTRAPYFATFFGEKHEKKVIIIADVLVRHVTRGRKHLTLPPKGFDTTEGKQGIVVVKFNDHEFYPRYVVDFIK